MTTLYIDRKGIDLDHEPGAIVLRLDGVRVGTLPLGPVDRIVLRGVNSIATRLLAELWQRRISVVLLGGRRGEVQGLLYGPGHADGLIRLRQYALHHDSAERIRRGRALIFAKATAQRRLLRQALDARPDCRKPLFDAIATVEAIRARLSAGEPCDPDQLLGLEGAAAAAYFNGLSAVFPPALGFAGRNRRPPRDPVNACLSLGYTLIHFEAVREVQIAGLDPLIGFFHQPLAGRESLAADFIEPLRPRIDRFVWRLFAEETLRAGHFSRDGEACLLGKGGRKSFYEAYESFAPPLRRWLRQGCRQLVRELRRRSGECAQ